MFTCFSFARLISSDFHVSWPSIGLDWQFLWSNWCDCWCWYGCDSYIARKSKRRRQHGTGGFVCERHHYNGMDCWRTVSGENLPNDWYTGFQFLHSANQSIDMGWFHNQNNKIWSHVSNIKINMVFMLCEQSKQIHAFSIDPLLTLFAGSVDRCIRNLHWKETEVSANPE